MPTGLKHRLIRLLRKAETITQTDNVYLAKSFSFLWSYQALTMVDGLILYFLFARYIPADVYGEYKYYLTLFEIFGISTLTGAKIALTPAIAKGFDGTLPKLYGTRVRYGFIGSAIATVAAGLYAWRGENDIAMVCAVLALVGPWINASGLTTAFFTGKKDFSRYAKTNLLLELAAFLLSVGGIFFWPNAVAMFGAYVFAAGLNLIVYWRLARGLADAPVDPDALSHSKYYSVMDGFNILTARIDSLIMFHLLGPATLALYSFANIPVDQMRSFLNHLQTVIFPKASVGDFAGLSRRLTRKLPLVIGGILSVTVLYLLGAPYLYLWLFPRFVGAVNYSRLLSLSLTFSIPAALYLTLFQAQGKKREAVWFNTFNNAIQIASIVVGVVFWGLLGAVIARLASSVLMFVLIVGYMSFKHVLPDGKSHENGYRP